MLLKPVRQSQGRLTAGGIWMVFGMDRTVAERMKNELVGRTLAGWQVDSYINHGKSALVFRASRGSEIAALKVFDREMVDRYGREVQRERVRREGRLIGHEHPHLIKILDAGEDTALDLLYVAMECMPGKNLAEVLGSVPAERIPQIVQQVASAARFLEELDLAHRDIKPDNIVVSDTFEHAVLLDLGVVRPVGFGNVTDLGDQRNFVATLQYSPPELLIREEQDTAEGWRAVTFYQLGAVMHDLLTGKRLFADEATPYGRLVEAVRHRIPTIAAPASPPELVVLAADCLLKSPVARLELVSWRSFQDLLTPKRDVAAARERVAQRQHAASSMTMAPAAVAPVRRRLAELRTKLADLLADIRAADDAHIPPLTLEGHDPSDHVCIRVGFAQSDRHALSRPFTLFLDVDVIDPEANAFRILGGLWFGSSPRDECARRLPNRKVAVVLEGVWHPDHAKATLADYLYLTLDAAQHAGSTAASEGWLEPVTNGMAP